MDFSETVVVCDVKVGRCCQLNDNMNLYGHSLNGKKVKQWISKTIMSIISK